MEPPSAAADDPPRILHALDPGLAGGAESVVQLLAAEQRGAGHDVAVAAALTDAVPEHPFPEPLREAGVPTWTADLAPRAYLREIRFLSDAIRRFRPEVVHTHGYRAGVLAALVARWKRIPVVSTVHGFTGGGRKNRLYEWIQVRMFRRIEGVVAVSRPLEKRLAGLGIPPSRIHVIPNAWRASEPTLDRDEARSVLDAGPEEFLIGWVGRLSGEKGADLFLDGLRALRQRSDRPFAASIVGDGRLRGELESRAGHLAFGGETEGRGAEGPLAGGSAAAPGSDARIRFHGAVRRAGRLFPAFDVFVLSSRTEGTPMVLFEAMEAEVPIVATRVGGVPDVVSEREALLVPPEDSDALAAAIRRVREDPGAAAARAAAARRRLRSEFAPGPWVARHEEMYRQVRRP